jgi:isopenicillin N synthase-like dioxygenase
MEIADRHIYRVKDPGDQKATYVSKGGLARDYSDRRSPIEAQIQKELTAVDISNGISQKLVDNMSKYGFAVIEPEGGKGDKDIIEEALSAYQDFCDQDLKTKESLNSSPHKKDHYYQVDSMHYDRLRFLDDLNGKRDFFLGEHQNWNNNPTDENLDLKDAAADIIEVLERNSQIVLDHITKLLKLKPGSFDQASKESDQSQLRMIHCISAQLVQANNAAYPLKTSEDRYTAVKDKDRDCVQVHTDWGLITLLPTATAKGLEFWFDDTKNDGLNSGWVSLPAQEGQLIAMPGNLMDIITGGKLRSIPHRVITKDERTSIAYFTEARKDTKVDNLKRELLAQMSKAGLANVTDTSYFEKDIRPFLRDGEEITAENYLAFNGKLGGELKFAFKEKRTIPPDMLRNAERLGFKTDFSNAA